MKITVEILRRKLMMGQVSIADLNGIVNMVVGLYDETERLGKSIYETAVSIWKFDNVITAQPPVYQGMFRFNNATIPSATQIFLHEVSAIELKNVANFIKAFETGDKLYIQQKRDETRWVRATISGAAVDNGDWWTIPITISSHSGVPIENNQDTILRVSF